MTTGPKSFNYFPRNCKKPRSGTNICTNKNIQNGIEATTVKVSCDDTSERCFYYEFRRLYLVDYNYDNIDTYIILYIYIYRYIYIGIYRYIDVILCIR